MFDPDGCGSCHDVTTGVAGSGVVGFFRNRASLARQRGNGPYCIIRSMDGLGGLSTPGVRLAALILAYGGGGAESLRFD